ncbi:hypothetical protein OEZ86_007563 [Tetradesmus obliquus]|nr:hypothetical protein OEZ86_007563 [Tetradesmus obliquus]
MSRQTRATAALAPEAAAAAAGTGSAAGTLSAPDKAALQRYGEHAKAAYILFDKFGGRNNDERKAVNMELEKTYTKDFRGVASLRRYTCLTNMLNCVGVSNAFAPPAKKAKLAASQGPSGILKVPSYLGYICAAAQRGDPPELVIAFRGTSIFADWANNLLGGVVGKGVFPKGRVHQGLHNMLFVKTTSSAASGAFKAPIKEIEGVMEEYFKEHNQYPPRIITTGHSLGGALATIAAAHIAFTYKEYREKHAEHTEYTQWRLQTYTFAAPRVGDDGLRSYFLDTLGYSALQVKNVQDPVPLFAPRFGEWGAALAKLGQLILENKKPSHSGATAAAFEASGGLELEEEVKIYEDLAHKYDNTWKLEQYIEQLERPNSLRFETAVVDMTTGRELRSMRQAKISHATQLLRIFTTKWSDNPAPPVGVFDSKKGGNWGGPMHSLEVYLRHIKDLQ